MTTVVNMHKAKSSLSRLVKRASAGEEIVIARRGKPVAMLTRLPRKRKDLPWGVLKGKIRMKRDFDAPLDVLKDYL
ncbi:MAG TPA: type II toxin-antitoxin system prevent-host-death family antitoxin [Bryobacteraceae bacterium]|nr:type II toxin-antitoxin system prevent-host-death family antitoxin [Bryobacteraceae bacterium]